MHSRAEANLVNAVSRSDARVCQSDSLARGLVGALLRVLTLATLASVPRVCWSQTESEQQATGLDPVLVQGNYDQGIGSTESASSGAVTSLLIKNRPTLRPAEVLEFIPGMIVTQHSGEGKANQYFLRGFNLDHGTDFASFVDGMPVNMPSRSPAATQRGFALERGRRSTSSVDHCNGVFIEMAGDRPDSTTGCRCRFDLSIRLYRFHRWWHDPAFQSVLRTGTSQYPWGDAIQRLRDPVALRFVVELHLLAG